MPHTTLINPKFPTLWHGGDYCPEQWPAQVWDQDMALMREARFTVATLGMFAWARMEPEEGRFDFGWLDEVVEKLTDADRWFILGTPSAAPPAWLSQTYPETLRTGADRVRFLHGNRVNFNLGSKVYREKTREIARQLAERYGNHSRLLAWHMSNEYGGADYGEDSILQFRDWLKTKFAGDLDALNHAYWTGFWGHTFGRWDQIFPPGPPYGETAIHGLTVDWQRFVTDQTLDFMLNEAAPLREISPQVPVTTNMMGTYPGLDYRKFAPHMDFICWDSYPAFQDRHDDPDTWIQVSFRHDLMRSLKPDHPWLLMEYTPSSSNWYKFMTLKRPGMHRFESHHALAHGADGLQYFQWRQSRGCQEQFHGGVVGHAGGNNTRVFADVRQIGTDLEALGEIVGSRIKAEVAIVFDWQVRWAITAACGPTHGDKGYDDACLEHYRAFWQSGIAVDLVGMDDDLSRYRVVIAPMAYGIRPGFAERIARFVESGGTLLATYLSGWVDEDSLVFENGFLAPLRGVLGVWSEELDVLHPEQRNRLSVDLENEWGLEEEYVACDFCELIRVVGAQVIGRFADDFYEGRPALTVNRYGKGLAFYVASRNEAAFQDALLPTLARRAGVRPAIDCELPYGVTAQVRHSPLCDYLFLLNASEKVAGIGDRDWGTWTLEPHTVKVLKRQGETITDMTAEKVEASAR